MKVFERFEQMGESMLLAQEGQLLIARTLADQFSRLFRTLAMKWNKLGAKTPTIESWHP